MAKSVDRRLSGGRQPGRVMHPDGTPTVLLQGRVEPDTRQHASTMADACGVSMGLLLQELIRHTELDPATGRPVWWNTTDFAHHSPEELPLAEAS